MSVSATSSSVAPYVAATTTTALTILAQVSASTAQEANDKLIASINTDIQNQLATKVAALQPSPDTALANALQAQITQLQTQQSAISTLTQTSVNNTTILSALQTQLGNLQTDAASGDSANFDSALTAANTYVSDLTETIPPAPFQPDQVSSLLGTGLGIGNSGTYDLSTPAGQAAAATAISAAQTEVGNVFSAITSNQLLGNSLTNSLNSSIDLLQNQQEQSQQAAQSDATLQIAQLTQQASDRAHLIELNLGSTSTTAKMIEAATNIPQPYTSVFQALEAAVSNSTQSAAPAILSLLT